MKILSSMFGGSGLGFIVEKAQRRDQALPNRELYDLLWAYYLNNGLYDSLREAGYRLENRRLKELYNPAYRAAEFFVDTIWPGTLDKAHPIVLDGGGPEVEEAIKQVWTWSNWGQRKQVAARWAAITGNVYLRVATPLPSGDLPNPERVFIQLIRPQYVTYTDTDERDYITEARLDIPNHSTVETEGGPKVETIYQTELWTRESLRIWHHEKGPDVPAGRLGEPVYEVELKEWGLDFVPIVHAKHYDMGDQEGVGAFTLALSKINELNRLATRLHQILFRHNDVTWALESNMVDASGRPLPPPRIRDSDAPNADPETVEMGGEKFYRLPGMSKLSPLVPSLDFSSHLSAVAAMVEELERDLPQLAYYKLKDKSNLSGVALRTMLMPALGKAAEARGSMEEALVRAQKMALTIGQNVGAFNESLGSYEDGSFDHHFSDRPILPLNRWDVAELAKAETDAGIPLKTSLRRSGWTEEEIAQMEDDKEEEQAAQSQTLATGLAMADAQMTAGRQSNGLEQPPGPAENGQPVEEAEENG